ncbi:MAG: TOBE domain-containing protein [Deltaproteobacteria bacterium]|nr:TOBE domain-containing protein [Deltaproteobacteria bacterium]
MKKRKHKIDRLALLRSIRDLGSISSAARALGISYKAAWGAVEEVNNLSFMPLVERNVGGEKGGGTTLTEHGSTILDFMETVDAAFQGFLEDLGHRDGTGKELGLYMSFLKLKTSARNQFGGKVVEVVKGVVTSEVRLDIGNGDQVVASITNKSVENLELHSGSEAFALIKASHVIVTTDNQIKTSARNRFTGTVSHCELGAVNGEVAITLPGGKSVVAVITNESIKNLDLKIGDQATAIFKASQVILATV